MKISMYIKAFTWYLFHKPEHFDVDSTEVTKYPIYTGVEMPQENILETTVKEITKYFETWGVKAEVIMLKGSVRYLAYFIKLLNIKRNILQDDPIYFGFHKLVKSPYPLLVDDSDLNNNSVLRICVPNAEFKPIPLSMYLEFIAKVDRDEIGLQLPILYGLDIDNRPEVRDMTITGNILMAGATGSGKSMLAQTIMNTFMYLYTPEYIKFLLVDMKRVDFAGYKDSKYLLSDVMNTFEEVFIELEKLCDRPEDKLYVLVLIDTFSELVVVDKKRFEDIIQRLTKRSKTYVIMWDSRPSSEVFTEAIKNCFATKVLFNTASETDSKVFCGTGKGTSLLGKGDAIIYTDNLYPETRVQCPYISYEDEGKLLPPNKEDQVSEVISDRIYYKAYDLVVKEGNATNTQLQNNLKIGYLRAESLIKMLMDRRVINQEGLLIKH